MEGCLVERTLKEIRRALSEPPPETRKRCIIESCSPSADDGVGILSCCHALTQHTGIRTCDRLRHEHADVSPLKLEATVAKNARRTACDGNDASEISRAAVDRDDSLDRKDSRRVPRNAQAHGSRESAIRCSTYSIVRHDYSVGKGGGCVSKRDTITLRHSKQARTVKVAWSHETHRLQSVGTDAEVYNSEHPHRAKNHYHAPSTSLAGTPSSAPPRRAPPRR